MKYCRYCGTELSDDARFCSNCGKQVFQESISDTNAIRSALIVVKSLIIVLLVIGFFTAFLTLYLFEFGDIRYGDYVCSDYDSEILDAYIGSHLNPFGFMQLKMTVEEKDKDRVGIIVTTGGLLGQSREYFDAKLCENNLAEKTYVISHYGGRIGGMYIGAPVYIRFIPGIATINIDLNASLDTEMRGYDEGATLIKLKFVKKEIGFR